MRKRTTRNIFFGLFTLAAAFILTQVPALQNIFFGNLEKEFPLPGQEERQSAAEDRMRFIAHAGGAIENHIYTNSLEALDSSYAKGFKLFELDIITTRDNHYVAAHDWERWQEMTGYKGELPPDHKTFKQYPLHAKYTPMDMDDINQWFDRHDDAILVTDKVNQPAAFSAQFIDKNRLMMELFTKDALLEGLKVGILSPMPNYKLAKKPRRYFNNLSPRHLQELGVTHMAASRRVVEENLRYVNELREAGIKLYVYHVNFEEGKDEQYVVCKEMRYVYGLYADNYDFSAVPECNSDE